MDPTDPQTGEKLILCIDSKGNKRWITPQEYEERGKNFDEEYMCPKSLADWKRSMGIPPLFSKKIN